MGISSRTTFLNYLLSRYVVSCVVWDQALGWWQKFFIIRSPYHLGSISTLWSEILKYFYAGIVFLKKLHERKSSTSRSFSESSEIFFSILTELPGLYRELPNLYNLFSSYPKQSYNSSLGLLREQSSSKRWSFDRSPFNRLYMLFVNTLIPPLSISAGDF